MADSDDDVIMVERIGRSTLTDAVTLEHLATIEIGVCDDEEEEITPLRVILSIDDNDHFRRKRPDLTQRRLVLSRLLFNLALDIKERFSQSPNCNKDLDIAIALHRKALQLTPAQTHPNFSVFLTKLADTIQDKYDVSGRVEDLQWAIDFFEVLVSLPSVTDRAVKAEHVAKLAHAVGRRYNKFRQGGDLDKGIALWEQVVALTTGVDHIDALRFLAKSLMIRSRHHNIASDLDDAIALYRTVCSLGLDGNSIDENDRARYVRELADSVTKRFDQFHKACDLEESIRLFEQLLKNESDPSGDYYRSMLGVLLRTRFDQSGECADLDRVISLYLEVLKSRPPSHPERYNTLINLGKNLCMQFEQTRQQKSLYDAITFLREAVDLIPSYADQKSSATSALSNLSFALRTRYEEEKQAEDLTEAFNLQKEVMNYGLSVSSISVFVAALFSEYQPRTGNGAVLDPMIQLCEGSLAICQLPEAPLLQTNLGNLLRLRYFEFQQIQDLSRAIQLLRQSISSLDESHPHQCANWNILGLALFEMSIATKDETIMDEGAAVFRQAVSHPLASLTRKFYAARSWAEIADRQNHKSAMEAYRLAIPLLPLLAGLNVGLDSRLEILRGQTAITQDLAVTAAACALRAGDVVGAIELLEAGRSVFWNQALKMRPPMQDLEEKYPDLAARFTKLGKDLETGSFTTGKNPSLNETDGLSILADHSESLRLRTLMTEWQDSLEEIRRLPGFEDFLQPHRFADFLACCSGPIIVLFTSPTSKNTEAIIMTKDDTKHVQLALTWREASALVKLIGYVGNWNARRTQLSVLVESAVEDLRNVEVENDMVFGSNRYMKVQSCVPSDSDVLADLLKVLWVKVVEPIVCTLGLTKSASPVRVHWCPASILAFLPFHAAGLYEGTKTESAMDYMTSSYTPTLTALLRPKDSISPDQLKTKMVVIIEPKSLPHCREEAAKIEAHVPAEILTKLGDTSSNPATISEVLRELPTASIVHFACHGKQDVRSPLDSALILADGKLSVTKIMQQEMRNPQLAFLSACETATGVLDVPDENMHLTASLLGVGFEGVVGTMWSIADRDGPRVADKFYYCLSGKDSDEVEGQKLRLNTSEAARALHAAVQSLRSEGVPLHRWVPFIHVGK